MYALRRPRQGHRAGRKYADDGWLERQVSTRMSENPASTRRIAMSVPASELVLAVAPGHRGCEAMAMRPPGRSNARKERKHVTGSSQKPIELTARTLSK